MIQNSAEGFESDLAFADVLVAVDARSQGRFRVVHMQYGDAIQADDVLHMFESQIKPRSRANVPARGNLILNSAARKGIAQNAQCSPAEWAAPAAAASSGDGNSAAPQIVCTVSTP